MRAVGPMLLCPAEKLKPLLRRSLLCAWPDMTRLGLDNFDLQFIRAPAPSLPPPAWVVSTRLVSLGLFIDSGEAVALFANLVKANSPTLRHITFQGVNIDFGQLTDVFDPVRESLLRLTYTFGATGEGTSNGLPAIVAALTRLEAIELPVEAVGRPALTEALKGREPIKRLTLADSGDGGFAHVSDLIELVGAVRVEVLQVGESW